MERKRVLAAERFSSAVLEPEWRITSQSSFSFSCLRGVGQRRQRRPFTQRQNPSLEHTQQSDLNAGRLSANCLTLKIFFRSRRRTREKRDETKNTAAD